MHPSTHTILVDLTDRPPFSAMAEALAASMSMYVLELGARTVRVGTAGEESPEFLIPAVVGSPKASAASPLTVALASPKIEVGQSALTKSAVLSLSWPLSSSFPSGSQLEDIEALISSAINFEPAPSVALVVRRSSLSNDLIDVLLAAVQNSLAVDSVALLDSLSCSFHDPLLPIDCTRSATGVALCVGHEETVACPVVDGEPLSDATVHSGVAGQLLTEQLGRHILTEQPVNFLESTSSMEALRDMKERCCALSAHDGDESNRSPLSQPAEYSLPDGQVVCLHSEHGDSSELLFDPRPAGFKAEDALHRLIETALKRVQSETGHKRAAAIASCIVLSGGTSKISGLRERLQTELMKLPLLTDELKVSNIEVYLPSEPENAGWRGASSTCKHCERMTKFHRSSSVSLRQ